jgi:hypothetical protein
VTKIAKKRHEKTDVLEFPPYDDGPDIEIIVVENVVIYIHVCISK